MDILVMVVQALLILATLSSGFVYLRRRQAVRELERVGASLRAETERFQRSMAALSAASRRARKEQP